MTLEYKFFGNRIFLKFDYDEKILTSMKMNIMSGERTWDSNKKHWSILNTPENFTWVKDTWPEFNPSSTKDDYLPKVDLSKIKTKLRPYQEIGVRSIEKHSGRLLIADEPGLGKSIQALSWVVAKSAFPCIVVCPSSVKYVWKHEFKTHAGIDVALVEQQKMLYEGEGEPKVIVINYDMIQKWTKDLQKLRPKTLILDESQMIKTKEAQRTKAVLSLARNVPYLIALSGTPVMNRPIEYFTTLNILDSNMFDNYFKFGIKYCGAKKGPFGWKFDGKVNAKELHDLLYNHYMIRRKKEDVLTELPAKQRIIVPVQIDNMDEYIQAENDFEDWCFQNLKNKDISQNTSALSKLTKLMSLAALGKRKIINQWIADFLDSGKKLVVFGIHYKMMDYIHDKFKDAVRIDGRTKGEDREKAVKEFQTNPDVRLFLGNIQAAGTGITLTSADTVVFAEISWTPSDLIQCEDRCLTKSNLLYCLHRDTISGQSTKEYPMIKNMEDVQIGDFVLGISGKWRKITDKWRRTNTTKPMSKITYVGWDEPVECTFDHRFFIEDLSGNRVWKEAHSILPGEAMLMPIPESKRLEFLVFPEELRSFQKKLETCSVEGCSSNNDHRGMCNYHYRKFLRETPDNLRGTPDLSGYYSRSVRIPDIIPVTDDLLYLMGFYLANGCAAGTHQISLSTHVQKRHILEKCSDIFSTLGLKSTIWNPRGNGLEMRTNSSELMRLFKHLFGHGAGNKSLPHEFMLMEKDQAEFFLRGYFDGDGYFSKNQQEWCSVSKLLCYQMCLLSAKCGYAPTMRKSKPEQTITFPSGQVCQAKSAYVGCFSTTKSTDDVFLKHNVREVSTYFEKRPYVYDLTVEEDESFLTGFALAHNCHRISQEAENVSCVYFVAMDTVEERILRVLDAKSSVISKVLDGEEMENDAKLSSILRKERKKL